MQVQLTGLVLASGSRLACYLSFARIVSAWTHERYLVLFSTTPVRVIRLSSRYSVYIECLFRDNSMYRTLSWVSRHRQRSYREIEIVASR